MKRNSRVDWMVKICAVAESREAFLVVLTLAKDTVISLCSFSYDLFALACAAIVNVGLIVELGQIKHIVLEAKVQSSDFNLYTLLLRG